MSIAVALLAVLFVFTGCESPTDGSNGLNGEPGKDAPFPDEIGVTVNIPPANAELIKGIDYPPENAKVLTGDAADIALAFNGGIFVVDTSDADGSSVSGNLGGAGNSSPPGGGSLGETTTYKQDAVDAVIWTGSGAKYTEELGALVVPPGKTLYVLGPLVINGTSTANTFTSVAVSDKGTVDTAVNPSILASIGSPVTGDSAVGGKIVVLASGSITDTGTAGLFTIGGELEIHQGGLIDFATGTVNTPIFSTPGSKITVFGEIFNGTQPFDIRGQINIMAGGSVTTGIGANTFSDAVILNGELALGAAAEFKKALTVGQGAAFTHTAAVTFGGEAVFDADLAIGAGITIDPTGSLAIKENSAFSGDWSAVSTSDNGDLGRLIGAVGATEPNTAANGRVMIAKATSGKKTLGLTNIRVTDYDDLVDYGVQEDIIVTYGVDFGGTFGTASLVIDKGNQVNLTGITVVGNIDLRKDGILDFGGNAITTGGIIKLAGEEVRNEEAVTFATALTSLTIGDEAGSVTPVTFEDGTLAGTSDTSIITVYPNAVLTLGGVTSPVVDPRGSIDLKPGTAPNDGGYLTVVGTGNNPTFARLKNLAVGDRASFSTVGNAVTFAALETLKVGGSFAAPETNHANLFDIINTKIGSQSDVGPYESASGSVDLRVWAVTEAKKHAFNQILGIKDVSVLSVTGNLLKTSGYGGTEDAAPSTDPAAVLTVYDTTAGITVPAGGLIVDRNLNLGRTAGTNAKLSFGAVNREITLNPARTISTRYALVGDEPVDVAVLGGSDQAIAVLTTNTGVTVLEATDDGELTSATGGITVKPAYIQNVLATSVTLKVPGALVLSGAIDLIAGSGSGYELPLRTVSLEKGEIGSTLVTGSNYKATVTVNAGGTLDLASVTSAIIADYVVEKTGIIKGTAAEIGSVVIAAGSIVATDDNGKIEVASGTVATLTGTFEVTTGAFASKATETLNLPNGTVKLSKLGSEYDQASLGGAVLTGSVTFTQSTGVILINASASSVAGGTLITKGDGVLSIGTIATLQTFSSSQTLGTLHGADGLTAGTLSLATDSELTILTTTAFKVGTTAAQGILDVGSGKIIFAVGNAKIEVQTQSTSSAESTVLNQFIISGHIFESLPQTGSSVAVYANTGDFSTGAAGSNDLFVTGTTGAGDASSGAGSTVTVSSGKPTITGQANSTLNSDSDLYEHI
jgi:hypothetical protein